ncbi:MAG: flippase [Candidatus Methanomethylicaceae archaeon]
MKNCWKALNELITSRSIFQELVTNNLFLTVGQIYQMGLSFLLNILLARQLGPEMIGIYFATQAMVGIVYAVARLGVDVPVKREVSRHPNQVQTYYGSALALRLFITGPMTLVVSVLIGELLGIGTVFVTALTVLYILVNGVTGLLGAAFQAVNRFDLQMRVGIGTHTLYFFMVALSLRATSSLSQILAVMVVGQSIALLVHFYVFGKTVQCLSFSWDVQLWQYLVAEGFPLLLAESTEYVSLRIDNLIVGTFVGAAGAGIYGSAYNIYMIGVVMLYLPALAAFPTLARFSFQHEGTEYRKLVRKLNIVVFLLSMILAASLYFIAPFVVPIVYGPEFKASVSVLQVLVFALPFVALGRLTMQALNAANLQKWTFRASLTGAIANIALNLALVPPFGYIAAAFTTVFTEAINWFAGAFGLTKATSKTHQYG